MEHPDAALVDFGKMTGLSARINGGSFGSRVLPAASHHPNLPSQRLKL
jgi:hypothetical protein